jgi:hypothetical protein
MTPPGQRLSLPDRRPEQTDLEQLAGQLTKRGCATSLYFPAPLLNIQPPGGGASHWVDAAGPHFTFQETAEPIGSRADIPLAADVICWVLRAHLTSRHP